MMPACVLLDLNLPGISGLKVLDYLRARYQRLPVVVMTADDGVDSVIEAMRLGAYDYLVKPLNRTDFLTRVRNAVEREQMAARLASLEREVNSQGYGRILGQSPAMKELYRQVDRVAASDVTVLIRGESGTGKELVAQAIHEAGSRADGPFEAVNCAAIPETLQESELFGHEKGAFTGATSRRIGRFELADTGTLFLDELGDLAPEAQAKLLRATQEKTFSRVGGSAEVSSDFRLVAATHRDLETMVREGSFREDLFFRVAVFELHLPPLRDRREDIPLLADAFLSAELPTPVSIAPDALAAMLAYSWPGNVRELQNAVRRAAVTAEGEIRIEDLPPRVRMGAGGGPVPGAAGSGDQAASRSGSGGGAPAQVSLSGTLNLRELEREAIQQAVALSQGNLSEAARQLGIARNTLYRKLNDHGLK
jgi:DNA-binding NtrC family response regulator